MAKAKGTKATGEESTKNMSRPEKFVKVAGRRTRNVLRQLRLLERCSNRKSYEFTPEQVDKIFGAINDMTAKVQGSFDGATVQTSEFDL